MAREIVNRATTAALLALSAVALACHPVPADAHPTETILYSFKNPSLGEPAGQLRFIGSALYGTGTGETGTRPTSCYGQVFTLAPSKGGWEETSIFEFNQTDGAYPFGGLVQDATGAIYGTTSSGGSGDEGVVFELQSVSGKWTESVLYNFTTSSGGLNPNPDLVIDGAGNIYGTTSGGGVDGYGTVFELSGTSETVLHSFTDGSDGGYPEAGFIATVPAISTEPRRRAASEAASFLNSPRRAASGRSRCCTRLLVAAQTAPFRQVAA